MQLPKNDKGRPPKGYRPCGTERALSQDWRHINTPYVMACLEAQAKANATGLDVGLFPCDLSQTWSTRYLPAPAYRTGDDTRMVCGRHCYVVRPEPSHVRR